MGHFRELPLFENCHLDQKEESSHCYSPWGGLGEVGLLRRRGCIPEAGVTWESITHLNLWIEFP